MKTAKKLLLTTTMVLTMGSTIHSAQAADNADVDVKAVTRNALVVTKDTDMDFGQLDVLIATQSGKVVLKTDGSIDVSATSSTVTATGGTPTAGQVTINTDAASPIDVTCTAGTMGNGAASTIGVVDITIEGDTTSSAVAADTDCTTAPAAVTPLLEDVVLKVGAAIDLSTTPVVTGNQTYDSTTGGTAPNIAAAYQ